MLRISYIIRTLHIIDYSLVKRGKEDHFPLHVKSDDCVIYK